MSVTAQLEQTAQVRLLSMCQCRARASERHVKKQWDIQSPARSSRADSCCAGSLFSGTPAHEETLRLPPPTTRHIRSSAGCRQCLYQVYVTPKHMLHSHGYRPFRRFPHRNPLNHPSMLQSGSMPQSTVCAAIAKSCSSHRAKCCKVLARQPDAWHAATIAYNSMPLVPRCTRCRKTSHNASTPFPFNGPCHSTKWANRWV
jgi:hypothetical protein